MHTFKGEDGFRFLDEREMRLRKRWLHYSPPETFSQMFRSPDWLLWKDGKFEASVAAMRTALAQRDREATRELLWLSAGVQVVRLQVVDAESIRDPASPLNYLTTYLTVTHPHEDRVIIDGDRCAATGIDLPDVDFLIHDDDLVITKHLGEPGVVYRDAYFNQPPAAAGDDDDRPVFRHYSDLADDLTARRDQLRYQGRLPGLDLLNRSTTPTQR